MRVADHVGLINAVLREYDDIFTNSLIHPAYKQKSAKDRDGNEYVHVYWPHKVGLGETSGLHLIDNMGIVTIELKLKKLTTRHYEEVGHTYRYINQDHTYLLEHGPSGDQACENYSFRYDLDFRSEKDPTEHLQVLHNRPRFITNAVALPSFLEIVKTTCFDSANTALRASFFSNA